jgi:hypothetical protein
MQNDVDGQDTDARSCPRSMGAGVDQALPL